MLSVNRFRHIYSSGNDSTRGALSFFSDLFVMNTEFSRASRARFNKRSPVELLTVIEDFLLFLRGYQPGVKQGPPYYVSLNMIPRARITQTDMLSASESTWLNGFAKP